VAAAVAGLALAALVAAHAVFLQRRRADADFSHALVPSGAPRQLSQAFFAGLIAAGWAASLDLVAPLDAIDHWVGFALLAGLGWKLIHEAVRLRRHPRFVGTATAALVLLLTGLTFIDLLVPGAPLPQVAAPLGILGAALLVLAGAPLLARRQPGPRTRRMADARFTIATGLLLLATATQVLIEHLP
jgi:putative Mn2+ efflux pump MntP